MTKQPKVAEGQRVDHTPGPWKVEDRKDGGRTVVDGAGRRITFTPQFEGAAARSIEVAVANARLIAAAPELLDACLSIISAYESERGISDSDIGTVRAAIAKAQRPHSRLIRPLPSYKEMRGILSDPPD